MLSLDIASNHPSRHDQHRLSNHSNEDPNSRHQNVIDWKKYRSYSLRVDPEQNDRALEISLCSFRRPHMRSFHCCWWSFFTAFFVWFAILPLLPYITESLQLSKEQVWTSNILGVGGTIAIRLILGPLCDRYGPRVLFSILLCCVSIATACLGFVQTSSGFNALRFCIGMAGGSFVMCQYWTTSLFAKEVVGTANALVAGWGNLGAGVTQLVISSALMPLFKLTTGGDDDKAWRSVCIIPAIVAFGTGVIVPFISDDCPKGNYAELKQKGVMPYNISLFRSFREAFSNYNTWLLFVQYAACFGVELTMNNASAMYFMDVYGQSSASAGAIAAIFGWMNLFARGLGGVFSDYMNYRWGGMRGRIVAQFIMLLGVGLMIFAFSESRTFGSAIVSLIVFSLFVQASEGTSFGIVPYIEPQSVGSVIGIVGAGGNVGAVVFGILFRDLNYRLAFEIMGGFVVVSTVLTFFIIIPGETSFLPSKDKITKQTQTTELAHSTVLPDRVTSTIRFHDNV